MGSLLASIQVQRSTGITPDLYDNNNLAQLNRAQVFPVTDTPDPYNPSLYTTVVSYTTANYPNGATLYDGNTGPAGVYATQSYTPTERPLATAKTNGKKDVRTRASDNATALRESSGYSADALSAAAAQLVADRGSDVQATIALTESVMDQVDVNLQAVDAATSVTDIADVVDAPDMVLNTGRGLSGSSLDINPSYFPTINLGNVVEADLELYIPATDRILGYATFYPAPYHFDSSTDVFTANDHRIIIRIAATGVVVGQIDCPDTGAGANVDVNVYTSQS